MSIQNEGTPGGVADIIARGMLAQLEGLRNGIARGVPRVGWKIGITDVKAQQKWGLGHSVIGCLAGDRAYQSGALVPLRPGATIRGEAEISIRLDREVPADSSTEYAQESIAGLGPAIELIDISMPGGDLETILSHNIFHAAVIFGREHPPRIIDQVESFWPKAYRNGVGVRQPEPSLVPRDLASLVLLVAGLLARHGETLQAGDRIISGSFVKPMIAEPGDAVKVDFGALGIVELKVA